MFADLMINLYPFGASFTGLVGFSGQECQYADASTDLYACSTALWALPFRARHLSSSSPVKEHPAFNHEVSRRHCTIYWKKLLMEDVDLLE